MLTTKEQIILTLNILINNIKSRDNSSDDLEKIVFFETIKYNYMR